MSAGVRYLARLARQAGVSPRPAGGGAGLRPPRRLFGYDGSPQASLAAPDDPAPTARPSRPGGLDVVDRTAGHGGVTSPSAAASAPVAASPPDAADPRAGDRPGLLAAAGGGLGAPGIEAGAGDPATGRQDRSAAPASGPRTRLAQHRAAADAMMTSGNGVPSIQAPAAELTRDPGRASGSRGFAAAPDLLPPGVTAPVAASAGQASAGQASVTAGGAAPASGVLADAAPASARAGGPGAIPSHPVPPGSVPPSGRPRRETDGAPRSSGHAPGAAVSIGTIEVTVLPPAPPPPAPPVAAPAACPVPLAARPRPAADTASLRAGLRRWYGTAQG